MLKRSKHLKLQQGAAGVREGLCGAKEQRSGNTVKVSFRFKTEFLFKIGSPNAEN